MLDFLSQLGEKLTPIAVDLAVTLAGAGVAYVAVWSRSHVRKYLETVSADKQKEAQILAAYDAIEAAVGSVYVDFVKQAKTAAADGRLTIEEAKQARDMAVARAQGIALKQGVDLFETFSKTWVEGKIQQQVLAQKATGQQVPIGG